MYQVKNRHGAEIGENIYHKINFSLSFLSLCCLILQRIILKKSFNHALWSLRRNLYELIFTLTYIVSILHASYTTYSILISNMGTNKIKWTFTKSVLPHKLLQITFQHVSSKESGDILIQSWEMGVALVAHIIFRFSQLIC